MIDVLAVAGSYSGGSKSTSSFVVFVVVAIIALTVMFFRNRKNK